MSIWRKSIPTSKNVCGYEIKKLTLGETLDAVERIKGLPGDIISECMPEVGLGGLFGWLKGLDEAGLSEFIGSVLHVAPRYVVQLVADLVDADAQCIMDDKGLGLSGLVKLIKAFWEVNELDGFFTDLGPILKTLGGLLKSGSKTSSPSA